MNFGKYSIMSGVQHFFEEEPEWYWKINPVTAGMELDMSKFLAHRRIVNSSGQRVELPPTSMEIAFREIALTFGGTNIPKETDKPVEDGGEPLLKDGASVEEIEAVLRHFPSTMLMEIWRAVGESYPNWGPASPN
jgi:hypothetical protein